MKAKIKEIAGPDATAKEFRRAIKPSLKEAVELWHQDITPLHFHPSAFFRYKGPDTYQPRNFRYNQRKYKRFGHRNPLQYSGQLKREVLRESRVSGTAKSATLVMRGPKYLFQFKLGGDDHDKAKELTAVHPQELKRLSDFVVKRVGERIKRLRITRVTNI